MEFSQLLAILHAVAPRACLEWGSGGSTQAVLRQCPFVERYVSIEHDGAWYERVRSIVRDPRLELYHVPADKPLSAAMQKKKKRRNAWNETAEIDPTVMDTYVSMPRTLGIAFDFVFVDGRARRFCLGVGFELLRPGGVLVIHDAQRKQYHDAINELGTPLYLEPWKQGQMCMVRKEHLDRAA